MNPTNPAHLVVKKWRPSLSLIVGMVVFIVLSLPLLSIGFFRIYENQLIHQTEAELTAQSVVLAASWSRDIKSQLVGGSRVGGTIASQTSQSEEAWQPLSPSLDLTRDEVLPPRPDPNVATTSVNEDLRASATRMMLDVGEVQKRMLTGFRLLDWNGVVIGGRDETGQSLAHVEEIVAALSGRFKSVMRKRVSTNEPPPLYSISRGTGIRIFTAMPVIVGDRIVGVIYASRTPSNILKELYDQRYRLAPAAMSVLGIALLIGFIFWRTVSNPVNALIAQTNAVAQGNRDAVRPLPHYGSREFAALSQSFLAMADNVHRNSDYLATYAAHVSHELKSPLTAIKGAAELLRDDKELPAHAQMSDKQARQFLDNIVSDSDRLSKLVQRLRELAKAEIADTKATTTLGKALVQTGSNHPHLTILVDPENALQTLPLAISLENLTIILDHLLDNSTSHGASAVQISAHDKADVLEILVQDNGTGIPKNIQTKIFDTFFTTRRETGGTGMGLVIVQALLKTHGGAIALKSDGPGAAFQISLPKLSQ
jgi:signal transduction histidine kinase